MMEYTVVLEKSEKNWSACVVKLDGCVAAADTREETLSLIQEAIEFHIDGLRNNGVPVPPPVTEVIKLAVR